MDAIVFPGPGVARTGVIAKCMIRSLIRRSRQPGSRSLGCSRHSRVLPPPQPATAAAACRKLDGVVAWLINGVAEAFFTSLELCSCILIDTKDDVDDIQLFPPDLHNFCNIKNRSKNSRKE